MLSIARVLKSNGTDGGILIGLHDIEMPEIDTKEPVFIFFDELPVPFFILDIQGKGTSKAIVHLNDVNSLADAEEIVGRDIFMEGSEADEEEEDFTGWTVFDKGRKIGKVTGIEPIPGNLCLYVGETLIPLHEDLVISSDPVSMTLNLDLPEGLL
jgi:16S rRNA processing protein RimM